MARRHPYAPGHTRPPAPRDNLYPAELRGLPETMSRLSSSRTFPILVRSMIPFPGSRANSTLSPNLRKPRGINLAGLKSL